MQTILFIDLDATLIENRFSVKVIRPLLQQIADASGETLEHIWQVFGQENTRRIAEDPDNVLTMDWGDIMRVVAERYDVPLSETVDSRWERYAKLDDITILDTAPDVLKRLQHPDRKIILSTKGLMKYQLPVLELTGFSQYFDDILTPDVTGYLKTTPAFFDKFRQVDALKIQIGDHYYDDVICAKRNGFISVMRAAIEELSALDPFDRPQKLLDYCDRISSYPEAGSDVLPDVVVTSLTELPAVIEQLEIEYQRPRRGCKVSE